MDAENPVSVEGMDGWTRSMQGDMHIDIEEDRLLNMTKETMMLLTFDSLNDAQQLYKNYARVNGFGIRMDDIYRNKHGEALSR